MSDRRPLGTILLLLIAAAAPAAAPLAGEDLPPLSTGQAVYVPVYSKILHGNVSKKGAPEELLLSSMLSVRNTDLSYPMTISSVVYYDTDGRVIRSYLTAPRVLPPMGSADFFVEYQDRLGGTGANFVVKWTAEQPINQPILETVQAYLWGNHSKAFTSRGQPIHLHDQR